MEFLKKDIQREETREINIDEAWLSSLKKVVISFFGCEPIEPLLFEHGRNIGQYFFHKKQEIKQNEHYPSQIYLNDLCEWLRKNGFGKLEISSYENLKKCECQINNYVKELDISYYCGLLIGLLECLWDKDVEIKCYQDVSEDSCKIVLQDAL